ncbi:hypothetical protein RN001_008609 [Aquatica leii]|uniref:Uncharacterized protein n=1 Tax=Aquatica leii TaxID=1421715 RepID=A0AAN7PAY5_9COLE|nr:hypothetical protein RN001_008609 [Aquatica leii]
MTFFKDFYANCNVDELQAVGCDGTVINTGLKNGVIRQLEKSIGRLLQWQVCLLHTKELPLRYLMQHLDRKTNDPEGFSGAIGKTLENCAKLSVVAFEPIEAELPIIDPNELSTDQKYLFDICKRISRGDISSSLSLRDPGKLTTANRIFRL